ncbi:MAG: helicase-associated domain-containing protein [Anaerolineae bacterium]|nr:helicase-associated domain-containing protein [Candidatus Roseilinea sp.]MDW8451787.1 helicase-associated domain-containing protein [Anaerolineae bacterium]
MRSLRACLLDEPLPRLMAMADLWDAPVEATSARDAAHSLALHMLQRERLAAARESLPPDARSALDALVAARGRMPAAAFERRFGSIRPMGPGRLERERPWRSPANAAEHLWYRGFIFRAFDRLSGAPTEVVFVPGDMLALLGAESRASHEEFAAAQAQSSPSDLRQSKCLDDVVTLLCFIRNHAVRAKAGDVDVWDAASRRAVAPMLRDAGGAIENDANGRFAFLTHLIARLGWTRLEQHRLRLVPQPVARWLQSPPDVQRDALFDAWLNDPEWNDLAHVDGLALEMTHAWSNDPVRARKAIVGLWEKWRLEVGDSTRALPTSHSPLPNQPLISDFIAYVHRHYPDFARPDGRYDTWHVRDVRTGEFLHGFENWERVEGALIRYIVEKPLRWLSDLDDEDTAPPATPFRVTDDGRIVVARHLRYERFQVARVADWVETRADAYAYQLSPRSLDRAREQGIRAGRVIEFLEDTGGQALPDGLKRALLRWEERGAEARLEAMMILRTQDGATMDALLRLPQMRRLMVERFAPNCIAIRRQDADAARAAIIESGLLVDVA